MRIRTYKLFGHWTIWRTIDDVLVEGIDYDLPDEGDENGDEDINPEPGPGPDGGEAQDYSKGRFDLVYMALSRN